MEGDMGLAFRRAPFLISEEQLGPDAAVVGLPEGRPRIAGAEVKWGRGTRAYRDTKSAVAEDLPEETSALLQQTAVAAYSALELRDYGRVDMRLQPDGRVHVIEVNPNPWLSSKAEFAMAARKSGRTYPQLVEEIVELAMARA